MLLPELFPLLLLVGFAAFVGFYLGFLIAQLPQHNARDRELDRLREQSAHAADRLKWLESNVWQLWELSHSATSGN